MNIANGVPRKTAFQLATTPSAERIGRPKEQLEYLSSLSFTWSKIAKLLCVSRMTIILPKTSGIWPD